MSEYFVTLLWQSTLLLGVAVIVARLINKRAAHAHGILVALIIAALAAPLFTVIASDNGWGWFAGIELAAPLAAPATSATGDSVNVEDTFAIIVRWLAIAWIIGACISCVRVINTLLTMKRLLARATNIDVPRWSMCVKTLAAQWKMRPPIVRGHPSNKGPMVWCGMGRAVLLVPNDVNNWDDSSIKAAVAHELGHVQRRDCVWSVLMLIACAMMWCQPLVWIASKMARDAAERACDDLAAREAGPVALADVLLRVVPVRTGLSQQQHAAAALSMAGRAGSVRLRIERLLHQQTASPVAPPRLRRLTVMLALLSITTTTALALAQRRSPIIHNLPSLHELGSVADANVLAIPGELDLGIVDASGKGSGVILLVNMDSVSRRILSVKTSCGCTTVDDFSPSMLGSGETMPLHIEMDAPKVGGERRERLVTIEIEGQEPLRVPVSLTTAMPGG